MQRKNLNPIITLIFFAILIITAIACRKEEKDPPPDNPGTGYQQYGTPFAGVPETEDIILYEVNLRAFSSTGDLQGVINRLDDIAALSVNVIWLMPIHPIGQINSVNSPYSVRDYKSVSTEYGDLGDLRNLTDEAHARGMAVIMDWVANHTAWDNPWISNTSWYTQDGNGNIIHPPGTNWLDVADLNYYSADMRKAMIDAMKYWVYEANVDGYRCDYADGVPFDFWQAAFKALDSIPGRDLIFFAEGTRTNHYQAGFQLNFGWQSYGAIKDVFNGQPAGKIFTAHNNEYSNLPAGKHWVRFTTNHDESAWDATPVTLFNGINGALAASVITIFTGGVPLIYGSQEVGTAAKVPFFSNSTINWNANPQMKAAYEKMLQFYSGSKVARTGQNTVFQHNDVVCFKKILDSDEILVIVNVRNSILNFSIPSVLENTTWTDVMTGNALTFSNSITLQPYQYFILD